MTTEISSERDVSIRPTTSTPAPSLVTEITGVTMDAVACDPSTNPATIQDCSYQMDSNCGQNEGAGVECRNDEPSQVGKT